MPPDQKIRIVVVDDKKLLRESLRHALKKEDSFEVTGEASNGMQAIDMICELNPDIALINIILPELNGIDAIPIIKEKSPKTKTLLLPSTIDEATILRALKNGAKGYLSKDSGTEDLIKAIKVIYNNELWIERKFVAKFFSDGIPNHTEANYSDKINNHSMTRREQDVLQLLIKGYTNKEIAQELFISEKTVKSHLNKVFRKLNVSRRLEAILCAIKSGIV